MKVSLSFDLTSVLVFFFILVFIISNIVEFTWLTLKWKMGSGGRWWWLCICV